MSQEIAPASDEAPIAPVPGAGERYGPVKAGDTLSELGFRLRPDPEVAGAQMAWALFESNPDAFINADVDKLMSGMYLRIPTREQALNTRYELAFAQVHGRQPAPSRPTPSSVSVRDGVVATSDAPVRVTPPAGTDVPVRPAPAPISADLSESGVSPESPESAPESAPESGEPTEPAPAEAGSAEDPAPAATAGGLKLLTREEELALETVESAAPREGDEESRLRDLLGRLQVEIAASNKETARVHERLTLLEQTIKELRGLIASKDQEIVRLQTVVSELQATSKQAAALEWLESNTVQRLAIEAAILLIAVLVMGWGLSRRTDARMVSASAADEVTVTVDGGLEVAVAEPPETEVSGGAIAPPDLSPDPVGASTGEEAAVSGLEFADLADAQDSQDARDVADPLAGAATGDPLTESDVYLAYGYYDKAKALLSGLVQQQPDEPEYRLRLLRVLHASDEAEEFLQHASILLDKLGGRSHEIWEEASRLGRELYPDAVMFELADGDAAAMDDFERTVITGARPSEPPIPSADAPDSASADFKHIDFLLIGEGDSASAAGSAELATDGVNDDTPGPIAHPLEFGLAAASAATSDPASGVEMEAAAELDSKSAPEESTSPFSDTVIEAPSDPFEMTGGVDFALEVGPADGPAQPDLPTATPSEAPRSLESPPAESTDIMAQATADLLEITGQVDFALDPGAATEPGPGSSDSNLPGQAEESQAIDFDLDLDLGTGNDAPDMLELAALEVPEALEPAGLDALLVEPGDAGPVEESSPIHTSPTESFAFDPASELDLSIDLEPSLSPNSDNSDESDESGSGAPGLELELDIPIPAEDPEAVVSPLSAPTDEEDSLELVLDDPTEISSGTLEESPSPDLGPESAGDEPPSSLDFIDFDLELGDDADSPDKQR